MWTSALPPDASTARATASASARLLRALTTTDAPPSASASAIAQPMLRPAPVTIATFPESSLLLISPSPRHAGLVPGIHVFPLPQDVDSRDKPAHDGS